MRLTKEMGWRDVHQALEIGAVRLLNFKIAESMDNGDFREREDLLRIGD